MNDELKIKMGAFTIDCVNPEELAKFYADLLGWIIPFRDENYVSLVPPNAKQGSYPYIIFQKNPGYKPPIWPDEQGAQQQMAHIDFAVNDMPKAVEYAIKCGARKAGNQFSEEWTVMFDPAGHPFCLCQMKHIFDSPDFGLL